MKNSDKLGWGPNCPIAIYKLNELLPLVSGPKVLDIGCGPGHLVNHLSSCKFLATGVDINKTDLYFAKKNYLGTYIYANATKLPFADNSFDTVFIRSVLEHIKDDQKALKEALRVGKKLIVIVPLVAPLNLKESGVVYLHYQDSTHLRNYSPVSLKKLIRSIDAKLIRIIPVERLPSRKLFNQLFFCKPRLQRIINKIFFTFFKEKIYYEELLAIIKK